MSAPFTYGGLLNDAPRALADLHIAVRSPYRSHAEALETLDAWRRLVATGVRHAQLLAPNDPLVRALPRLRPARQSTTASDGAEPHPARQAMSRAEQVVGLAHDVLGTHLGPDRQHRTPDVLLIDDAESVRPALRTVSSVLLTAAVAHQPLARRAMDLRARATRIPPYVARILTEGVAVLGPAARLHDRFRLLAVATDDVLGRLAPAPLLTGPSQVAEPIHDPAAALARLRVAAHRQARGELPAGAPTVRALTAVALALVRSELDRGAGRRQPNLDAAALADAGRCWARLHADWAEVRTLHGGARGVLYDSTAVLRWVADSEPGGHGTSRTAADAAEWLATVATSLGGTLNRLAAQGEILVPTRWCDGDDIPRRWTTPWPEHLDRLAQSHASVLRAVSRLRSTTAWRPTTVGRSVAPLARAVGSP